MADKHSTWPLLVVSVVLVCLQAFHVISQGTTTSGVTDTPTNAVTIATTNSMTQAATNAATNEVTIETTNSATDSVTEAATNAVTNTVTVAATNTLTNAVTDEVTNLVTDAMTEAVTGTVTDAWTNIVTGAMTEAVTETVTDAGTNAVTDASISPDVVTDIVTVIVTELVNVTSFTDASNTSNTTLEMEKKIYKLDQTRTVIIPTLIFTLLLFLLVVMIFIATYTRIRLKKSISTYRLTPAATTTSSHVGYQNTAYEHGDIADDTDIECSMRDIRLDVTSTNGNTMNLDPEALKNPEGLEEELTPL